ncbi:MAG: oxygenase MpaB family protein [Pseudomonadales bacterium]|nr:oxygenase MpaB family protein [Pseudomonadales bacterium]
MSITEQQVSRLDFNSTKFDSTMERCFGEHIVAKAKQLKQSVVFQEKFARNFNEVDTVADALAAKMKADPNTARDYSLAVKAGISAVDNPSSELVSFIESAENIPAFIDRDKVDLGGRVFQTKLDIPGLMLYGFPVSIYNQAFIPSITLALLFSMQPKGDPATIIQALATKSNTFRGSVRLLETFKWFGKVSDQGAGQLYSAPYLESCRIRLVHAHIRSAINAHKNDWNFSPSITWRTQELGMPLCAADGSIVVSSVVAAIYSMRRHLKKNISRQELDALNHWSNYVSYLQGVPEDLLFPTAEDTVAYFAAFMMSINVETYHHELASFVESFQNLHMEKAMFRKSKSMQFVLSGLIEAIIDETFSDDVKSFYRINKAPLWAKSLLRTTKAGIAGVNLVSGKSKYINQKLEDGSILLWKELIPEAEKVFGKRFGSVVS